jgi:tRNA A-37 threonylcarbamoyl transferase component Bud32
VRVCPECKRTFGEETQRCPHDRTELLDIADDPQGILLERDALQRLDGVQAADSRFTILEKIGQGGWGGVYRAYQHSTRREVALKVLRKDVAEDTQARRRFHREAEAVSKLKHPNTVTVFDFGETPDGLLFIAMEYVEGRSLDAVVRDDGPLTPLRTAQIGRQVALSLAEAHTKGIVHRDIKPHNVMLTSHGDGKEFVKVLDFGVAKLASVESALTATGSTFGTPEYMSPEQVQSKDVDHRSDLYALGIVMYEMLSGRPPFTGKSPVTVAMAHIRKRPPAIRPAGAYPRPLLSLLRRLLAKAPSDRPASARETALELERIEHLLATAPPPKRTTEVVQQVIGTVSANWGAALTVLAVVCMICVALVIVRERINREAREHGGQGELASQAHQEKPPGTVPGGITDVREETEAPSLTNSAAAADALAAGSRGDSGAVPPEGAIQAPMADGPEMTQDIRRVAFAMPPPRKDVSESADRGPAEVRAETKEALQTQGDAKSPALAESDSLTTIRLVANVTELRIKEGKVTLCRRSPCTLTGAPGTVRKVRARKRGYRPQDRVLRFGVENQTVEIELERESLSSRDELKGAAPPSDEDGLK